MREITAVIVDDEPLALARMRRLLEEQGARVVGEADKAADAIRLVEDLQPHLLFADVEMPGITGIHLGAILQEVGSSALLVYVTGYSEHAVAAFEREAFDYLLKPVSPERLAATLARARRRLRAANPLPTPTSPASVLPIREDFAVRFISVDEIICAVAHDKRVFVRTAAAEHRTSYTLTQLEGILPEDRFLRIHDSHIINLSAVSELLFLGDHSYEVRLKTNDRFRVGRSRYPELLRRLGLHG